ncbi:hypothetical protein LOD99_5931 [Oopsacas minuta]|uniref:Uncharacterized protein n=1 Tax=Oopsacas minuta TaxID=111878 RepID=A0AAV7JMQ7_9METZ|nr:hypothetical protein LOD99_5931 [Oopsacas minuta]
MDPSMVQQLQSEVGLLVRELKERDRELNSMVLSHQQQQACWNKDREVVMFLRDQLSLAEERNLATDRELRSSQVLVTEYEKDLETERAERCRLDQRVQEARTQITELESTIEKEMAGKEQLIQSLQSADSRIAELSSNEIQMKKAIKQTLEGAESLEQDLQDKVSCLEELGLIRGENEQLREEANASRDRCIQLSNQLEGVTREFEREREISVNTQSKLNNNVSTLEKQLEVYRTAEERKTHLLSSYRTKQERLENELRCLREETGRYNSNGSVPLQNRTDLISPHKPTRDLSPSSPIKLESHPHPLRIRDDPFPTPSSPVSPCLMRPCTLEIIQDVDETDLVMSQEVDRVAASLELKLDTILHSIDPPRSPCQHNSLSAIPEEELEIRIT